MATLARDDLVRPLDPIPGDYPWLAIEPGVPDGAHRNAFASDRHLHPLDEEAVEEQATLNARPQPIAIASAAKEPLWVSETSTTARTNPSAHAAIGTP